MTYSHPTRSNKEPINKVPEINTTNAVVPPLTDKQKTARTKERIRVSQQLLDAIQPTMASNLNNPDALEWALYEVGNRLRNARAFSEAVEDLETWREHVERIIKAHDRMECRQGYVHGNTPRIERGPRYR